MGSGYGKKSAQSSGAEEKCLKNRPETGWRLWQSSRGSMHREWMLQLRLLYGNTDKNEDAYVRWIET